ERTTSQVNLKRQLEGSLFTSKSCASTIMHKLESQAKKLNFNISRSNENEYKLKMQGISEGRKGKLLITGYHIDRDVHGAVGRFKLSIAR
nr:CBL-interacting serine/threonine-protein kinase 25-like [Tanacetum cinerariifolium]